MKEYGQWKGCGKYVSSVLVTDEETKGPKFALSWSWEYSEQAHGQCGDVEIGLCQYCAQRKTDELGGWHKQAEQDAQFRSVNIGVGGWRDKYTVLVQAMVWWYQEGYRTKYIVWHINEHPEDVWTVYYYPREDSFPPSIYKLILTDKDFKSDHIAFGKYQSYAEAVSAMYENRNSGEQLLEEYRSIMGTFEERHKESIDAAAASESS